MNTDRSPDRPTFAHLESRPIDPVFHSVYEAGPFTKCVECKESFIEDDLLLPYIIMKVFVHTEVIIELALCWDCRTHMQNELSRESEQSMTRFLADHFHSHESIESCAFCPRMRDTCRSYSIYAFCIGDQMIVSQYPIMICDLCEELMQELMSNQTRGWQDNFMDRHFSGPSLELDPKMYPILI